MGKQFLNGIVLPNVTTLPSAAANTGVMLRQGGTVWFCNGAAWVDLAAAGGGVVAPVTARIRRSTNQSIPSGAGWTDLVWDASAYQVNGSFWTSGATVTIPENGYYMIVSECTFDGAGLIGSITAEVRILVNGSAVIDEALQQVLVGFPSSFLGVPKRQFVAGDTIKVQVRHSNASAVNVLVSSDNSPDIILSKDTGAKGDPGSGGSVISTVNLNIATMSEIFDATVAVPGVVTANKIQTWVEGNQSSQNATDDAYVAGLSAYARVSATDQITFTIRSATPFQGPVRLSYFIY